MNKERSNLKEQLNKELNHLHFLGQQKVLNHIHNKSWKQRIKLFMNKEIELPILPVSTVFLLLFLSFATKSIILDDGLGRNKEKILIEAGGNVYWKEELLKVESKDEES
ncbi:hypothetical protein SPD48_01800 [Pseudogracilibacillus sp. SE30717A]|uniref:hypothetical protein n=1 Tax=Pseudogracilibacillus sp. SE30717A TaxID=3098293 RepID=UPI00300E314E